MQPRFFRENPKYITRHLLGWMLRVCIGDAPKYKRIHLGLFPSRREAQKALHDFGLLLFEHKCPWKARSELYRQLGRPEPLPLAVRIRRKSIKVPPQHRETLVKLYLRRRIPVDQYEGAQEELRSLTEEWNRMCGRNDRPEDVYHYMRNERKSSKWVRFNGRHKDAVPTEELTPEETQSLVTIYSERVAPMRCGADVLGYDLEIREIVAAAFHEATGREVAPEVLAAKITNLRKRGLLPKVSIPQAVASLFD